MRLAVVYLLILARSTLQGSPNEPALEKSWQEASAFLTEDAYKSFTTRNQTDAANQRERGLGEAVTLLNKQPRTEQNILKSRSLLEDLTRANPNDDPGIFASYMMARIYQFHENLPQPEKARIIYRELIQQHSGHALAESAAAGLVLLELYENVSKEQRNARFADMEKLAPLLKTAPGRRQYHLNLGQAYIDFGVAKDKAIEHLLAADAEGITRWRDEAAAWIAIGELARAEKRDDLAATYYSKFLAKYRRDNRSFTIQKRLEAIKPAVKS